MTARHLARISALALALGAPLAARADGTNPPDSVLDDAIVDIESGVVLLLQNDGRYGADGTEFGVAETNQRDNLFIGKRVSFELRRGSHRWILLYAPLDVTTRATLEDDLTFRDVTFAAGTAIQHRYLFDGYRASYAYRLLEAPVALELGGSLQIRNANVAFADTQGQDYVQESDIGFVPAAKLRLTYRAPSGAYALLGADGLSTFGLVGDTEGGIYDVALTLGLPVTDYADLVLRVRALGGGATVPDRELENWAHFLAVTAGLRFDLAAMD
jgi:hypothetical protein